MQYISVNIQTLARADGRFLNEKYMRYDTLKIKRHQVTPVCPQNGGIGDIK
jgi:hypothetical protein